MRVVKEIPHPELKITVFQWNNRYLIKFEAGLLEQTYKVNEYDVTSEDEMLSILSNEFLNEVILSFQSMAQNFQNAITKI